MKIRTLLLFTVIFITAGASFHVHAEQKESGIVNGTVRAKKAKYLKDAVVYIENIPDTFEPKKEHAVIDQKNMAFIPHILPVIKGTTVDFLNSDLVQHNVYSPDDVADNVNLGTWLKGEVKSFTFGKLGVA